MWPAWGATRSFGADSSSQAVAGGRARVRKKGPRRVAGPSDFTETQRVTIHRRALLGWIKPSNQAQQSVIDALNAGPRPKKSRKSKAA